MVEDRFVESYISSYLLCALLPLSAPLCLVFRLLFVLGPAFLPLLYCPLRLTAVFCPD